VVQLYLRALGTRLNSEEVTLRLTVSQSVCLGIEHPCGTCDQILLPVGMLLSEICGLVSLGRPLWREDGYAICSVITQWSESRRTRNHTLLSHLRLPQPGGPGSPYLYPLGRGWPSYTPGHWVWASKGVNLCILDLGSNGRRSASVNGACRAGGWVGLRAGLVEFGENRVFRWTVEPAGSLYTDCAIPAVKKFL
jgi:hypothetical protein